MVEEKVNIKKGVVICGPTASGKTALALSLCETFNGEIISADSRQIYKYMDIGTGKPSVEERKRVRHYVIDVVEPDEWFDAGKFVEMADSAYLEIVSKGKVPFIVGGTGLYIRAMERGLVPSPPVSQELRTYIREVRAKDGVGKLYEWLRKIDRESADRIHPNDYPRIERAIIYYLQTGRKISDAQKEHSFSEKRYEFLKIFLNRPKKELSFLIEKRVYDMVKRGWIDEVRGLMKRGYDESSPGFASIGYREMLKVVKGEMSLRDAIETIVKRTKDYAKRQIVWFKKEDVLMVEPDERKIAEVIKGFLNEAHSGV